MTEGPPAFPAGKKERTVSGLGRQAKARARERTRSSIILLNHIFDSLLTLRDSARAIPTGFCGGRPYTPSPRGGLLKKKKKKLFTKAWVALTAKILSMASLQNWSLILAMRGFLETSLILEVSTLNARRAHCTDLVGSGKRSPQR